MLSNTVIEKLVAFGGERGKKGKQLRIYLTLEILGFEYDADGIATVTLGSLTKKLSLASSSRIKDIQNFINVKTEKCITSNTKECHILEAKIQELLDKAKAEQTQDWEFDFDPKADIFEEDWET